MPINLLIPDLNNKPDNTKDAVITILTIEWPLTLRNIYYKIKKNFGYSSSYQSVYKSVKELKEKGILKENSKKYEINIDWIKKVQSFTDIVETNYYAKEKFQNFRGFKESSLGEDMIILHFDTLFDAEKYIYYFMKSILFKKKNDKVCYQLSNEWRPIYYLRAEFNYYKRFLEKGHKFYFLCSGKSFIENISKKFYKSIGINYKTIKEKNVNDILVFDDYFIEIFIPDKIKNKISFYLKKKDVMSLLKNVLDKKTKESIKLVIHKDSSLSNEVKKRIIRKF